MDTDRKCSKCKYFRENACYYFPPDTEVIMANSMGGQSPAVMSYRPKVEPDDLACNFYYEDLDR